MVQTAQAVLGDLQGLYAYTESDEISVLFPRSWTLFDRELEKTVSISASIASAALSLAFGTPVDFDSRAILAAEDDQVVDYFRWRQADAARCALNGWCYWTLRKAGQSVAQATAALAGKGVADKNELLFQQGVNFNGLPQWQRRGTGLYWECYEREGYNPKLDQKVVATRRRIKVNQELPMGEEYAAFVGRLMGTGPFPTIAGKSTKHERGDS
jgi:tRNA(His) 5'-end guanylyltransferase